MSLRTWVARLLGLALLSPVFDAALLPLPEPMATGWRVGGWTGNQLAIQVDFAKDLDGPTVAELTLSAGAQWRGLSLHVAWPGAVRWSPYGTDAALGNLRLNLRGIIALGGAWSLAIGPRLGVSPTGGAGFWATNPSAMTYCNSAAMAAELGHPYGTVHARLGVRSGEGRFITVVDPVEAGVGATAVAPLTAWLKLVFEVELHMEPQVWDYRMFVRVHAAEHLSLDVGGRVFPGMLHDATVALCAGARWRF